MWITITIVIFQGQNLWGYLKVQRAYPLKEKDMAEISKLPTSWKL